MAPNPPPGQDGVSHALSDLASFIMNPRSARAVPRPLRSSVVPTLYHGKLSITSKAETSRFQGTIFLRQNVDAFLEVHVPGAVATFENLILAPDHGPVSSDLVTLVAGITYTIPMVMMSGTDVLLESVLVEWTDDSFAAWNHANRRFETGKAWLFRDTISAASHTYSVSVGTSTHTVNNLGGYLRLVDAIYDETAQSYSEFNSADITLVSGTENYTDTNAFVNNALFGFRPSVDEQSIDFFNIRSDSSMDCTTSTEREIRLPVQYGKKDPIFEVLRRDALQASVSAFDGLLSFSGNVNNSGGEIGGGLVDSGWQMPHDGKAGLSAIASLGEGKSANFVLKEGVHGYWTGGREEDYYLQTRKGPRIEVTDSPYLYFAWDAPSVGTDGQPASLLLQSWVNVEWVHPSQSLPHVHTPLGGARALLDAISVLSGKNPISENPKHLTKVKDGIKAVVNNPMVRSSAKFAVQAAKIVGPMILGML